MIGGGEEIAEEVTLDEVPQVSKISSVGSLPTTENPSTPPASTPPELVTMGAVAAGSLENLLDMSIVRFSGPGSALLAV